MFNENFPNRFKIELQKNIQAKAIFDHLFSKMNELGFQQESWYVGITDDLGRRIQEHEDQGKNIIGTTTLYVSCNNAEIAKNVEELFREKGFNGADKENKGGSDKSTIVYAFVYK